MSQTLKGIRIIDTTHRQAPGNDSDELGAPQKPRKPFRTRSVSLGRCLLENLDDISEIIVIAEGEDHT
jgi:hypothetical protein